MKNYLGKSVASENTGVLNGCTTHPILNGQLHFAKFETTKMNECLDFIESKQILGSCKILYALFLLPCVSFNLACSIKKFQVKFSVSSFAHFDQNSYM